MNNKPTIKVLPTSEAFKVLEISGEAGDVLEKHKVNENGLLLVRAGNIVYAEADREVSLGEGECWDIPANVVHQVLCIEAAKFFVVMPTQTKMRFEKSSL